MKTVCAMDSCSGCNACETVCSEAAITIEDSLMAYNAVIDEAKCVGCNACMKVCPNNNPVRLMQPQHCMRGWANSDIRKLGSSGGIASAIIHAFINAGGFVCSCLFADGRFIYRVTSDNKEALAFAGSKYVKSDPGDVYVQIRELLKSGERVLFIGLPCHVAALRKVVGDQMYLYTIDLICHGTPSPKLLTQYLTDNHIDLREVRNIKFRNKNDFCLTVNGSRVVEKRVVDSYTNAFLAGVDYTENCYSCRFATVCRAGDITLGDFWGSDPKDMELGASLILCQNEKGEALLKLSNLILEDGDLQHATAHNHQLMHPTPRPPKRNVFFAALQQGKRFNTAYFRTNPKDAVKQSVKVLLSRMKLM